MSGRRCSVRVVLLASAVPALASAQSLDDAVRRCATDSDQTRRLACFDAVAGSLPRLEADRIGMTADIQRQRDPSAPQTKDQVLRARISGLRQAAHGAYIFTLDNQQVWAQAEASPSVDFVVGEDVRIEHGAMSSLWLVAHHHRRTRVTRLQ
jgi:hypothetical protein